jgi:multidrug resistance efflux pump
MNWRRILIIAFVVIIIAAIGFFVFQQFSGTEEEAAAGPTTDVDSIAVDTGVNTVGAEGILVPLRNSPLSVPFSGQIVEIYVSAGDAVNSGDPLLRLDSADQEIALQQAQSGIAQAEASLQSAQAGLQQAEKARNLAELGVTAAEAQLDLVEAGPTEEQVALSRLGVEAAEAGISAAAGNQALVLEGAQSSQILAAESRLQAAQAAERQLRNALNEASGDQQLRLEDQLLAAVANVSAAQAALDEVRQGATQAERSAAGAAVAQANSQVAAAQAQLDLLQVGAREEQLELARVGVRQAEAGLAETALAVEQAETAIVQAEAGLEQAQATFDAAQKALDMTILNAPFAGTVADMAFELGEVASPGLPAVVLADFDGWLVETTDLKEQDVVALAVGFPVEVILDALPSDSFAGSVIDISPVSSIVDGDVTYVVTISLEDVTNAPLRWGMTAAVDIDVEK